MTSPEIGDFDEVPAELATALAAGFNTIGRPDLAVEWCRSIIARTEGTHLASRSVLAIALTLTGATDESLRLADDLLHDVQRTDNPVLASAAYLAHGWARRYTHPTDAYNSFRRARTLAMDGGNKQQASVAALLLSGPARKPSTPLPTPFISTTTPAPSNCC